MLLLYFKQLLISTFTVNIRWQTNVINFSAKFQLSQTIDFLDYPVKNSEIFQPIPEKLLITNVNSNGKTNVIVYLRT